MNIHCVLAYSHVLVVGETIRSCVMGHRRNVAHGILVRIIELSALCHAWSGAVCAAAKQLEEDVVTLITVSLVDSAFPHYCVLSLARLCLAPGPPKQQRLQSCVRQKSFRQMIQFAHTHCENQSAVPRNFCSKNIIDAQRLCGHRACTATCCRPMCCMLLPGSSAVRCRCKRFRVNQEI